MTQVKRGGRNDGNLFRMQGLSFYVTARWKKWISMTQLLICDSNLVELEKTEIAVSLENRFACYNGYEGDVTFGFKGFDLPLFRIIHDNKLNILTNFFNSNY